MIFKKKEGFQRAAQVLFSDARWRPWIQNGLSGDLQKAFGKLWLSIDAFRIEDGNLKVITNHPAARWEIRLRKREILEPLKNYGISNILIHGRDS